MASSGRLKEFLNRNMVTVVMVPVLFVIHWGWVKLQDNEKLVRQYDKKELPLLKGIHYMGNKLGLTNEEEGSKK
ncbi:uncharacterized protein LOC124167681 [Ischnura elegans]|uniref:uncharacterized protein LOC124167681 n=1 Tax=Ischnura elegans TaxID=197161 RepID=UPI001ED87C57|nr:uncharacterized protein LOC124167681 [Ischnura elegans]